MSSDSLPAAKAAALFSDLLGRKVRAIACAENAVDAARPLVRPDTTLRAVYRVDAGDVGAVAVVELSLAACLGAALVMIGPAVVQDCCREGRLDEALVEHCAEVMNVAAQLINRPGGPHHRLAEIVAPGDPLGEEAAAVVAGGATGAAVAAGTALDIAVDGYGSGRLTLIIA